MLYFPLGGILYYHRTLRIVQFLLFLVMAFQFSYCASIIGKSESLQHMMVLPRYHGNNQESIYELSVDYVEETKV